MMALLLKVSNKEENHDDERKNDRAIKSRSHPSI